MFSDRRRYASQLPPESRAASCSGIQEGLAQPLSPVAGTRMEGARQQDLHVHRAPGLAHCLAAGWEVQEDTQKHHDQPDGHPGGGHQETGESGMVPRLRLWVGTAPGAMTCGKMISASGVPEETGPRTLVSTGGSAHHCRPPRPHSFEGDWSQPLRTECCSVY